ncbi:MAG: hypothetical protein JWO82_3112, partial [Akkermansiaceae bacterium]|nr:hypothetical protein [Akkermansiaceae bacterium]
MTTPEDPSDRLIDSLLREQARRRAADEELIASIHAALDGAGGKTTARMKRFSPRMGLLLASAAAVVLVAGGMAIWKRGESPGVPQIVSASSGRQPGFSPARQPAPFLPEGDRAMEAPRSEAPSAGIAMRDGQRVIDPQAAKSRQPRNPEGVKVGDPYPLPEGAGDSPPEGVPSDSGIAANGGSTGRVEAPPMPPAAAIAALPKALPVMPEPATPRPGLNEGTVAKRVEAGESSFVLPDAPSEALADAELPPGLDTGRGAGSGGGSGGGRGSGSGVGSGTGPGRGVGETYDRSLGDRRTNQAQVAGISHDAIPGSPQAFDKERGVVQPNEGANGEHYGQLVDQPWKSPWQDPLSTFSIDVDAASYTNIRRMIRAGKSIPPDAVRIEECLNYFDYRYEGPKGNGPFAVLGTLVKSPLQAGHLLARVAIKGREIEKNARPASNLVFLIDVSGSMQDTMKLPLLQRSLELLVDQLDERDQVGIVVYAGNEGVVLDSTRLTGDGKSQALQALKKLEAGGSTNGGAGIKRAYQMAASHFIPGGVNRVILATDGDFNVGTTSQNDLVELVKEKAKSGVNLTVTSFGDGNLNDAMLEAITKDGNGNYYYIDSDNEGRRIFLEKL